MKTNLIFRKQVTVDGNLKTITRIVSVDIPYIDSNEGWLLSGHCQELDIAEDVNFSTLTNNVAYEEADTSNSSVLPEKFISDVSGTAKLVRSKGVIKIVARRGKSTYNQTALNSVCISDLHKNSFFHDCRSYYGANSGCYEINIGSVKLYEFWNKFMDEEYKRQQIKAIIK